MMSFNGIRITEKNNFNPTYSITSALVSETKKYVMPSQLDIKIINKKEFYLKSVISKTKKEKLSFKTAYNKTQLDIDWDPPSYKDIKDISIEHNKIKLLHKN